MLAINLILQRQNFLLPLVGHIANVLEIATHIGQLLVALAQDVAQSSALFDRLLAAINETGKCASGAI